MNVFYTDECPVKAAFNQIPKHRVKMPLESCQILCTAHRELDGDEVADKKGLYKRTHTNHPSCVWVRESVHHYNWLYKHWLALNDAYLETYGEARNYLPHLSIIKFSEILKIPPANIKDNGWVDPPQCMPDEFKDESTIVAYRQYYKFKEETIK